MNQMYLSDIDLMKFEHTICSDLDMFMIECYDDYYYEAEGTKEGIFAKIKRKIKEIFEKLKAIFRGNKVKQMDKNIEMAQKAVQQMSSEQKSKKVEVFDGEKALKLIEEDHEKAKNDPNHKRLDKSKLIALCTIPVTIAVAITILIKNKKALPKILDKEKEINKEIEQAEKEVQKQQEQVKKETKKAQEVDSFEDSARKEAMSTYRSEMHGNYVHAHNINRKSAKEYANDLSTRHKFGDFEYKYNPNDDLQSHTTIDRSGNRNDRFRILTSSIFNKTTGLYVGQYTLIIDTVNKTAKEILDLYNTSQPRLKSHIDKIDISLNDKGVDSVNYHSKILNRDETKPSTTII